MLRVMKIGRDVRVLRRYERLLIEGVDLMDIYVRVLMGSFGMARKDVRKLISKKGLMNFCLLL